ncbi:MAG: AzlC family ABC transporter permease [Pigmentiphaga sp.]|uniref:AzlC family ABC transporter permease n=1 Tax=Pigmentiphaga sp. TaxID=1977564 RepID=UPI0029BF0831|nr:AzlC family ABC transporter permease [Pigmentiphaga sp.]MDX3906674.1 AzlC family ABC transporter permease [Pigmentiphaga sp.]
MPDTPPPAVARGTSQAERRTAFLAGLKAMAPTGIAIGVWGVVSGVAMVKLGLSPALALAMTFLVYAGSAQLAALPLIAAGAPVWLVFVAGCIVNLRFVIFAAALHPYFRHFSAPRRIGLGFLTSDIGFVLFMPRYGDAAVKGTPEQTWFFLGVAAGNWVTWQVCSVAGILLGAVVPQGWSLEFAGVLALLAIVVPMVANWPVLAAVAVAALVGWAGQPLPLRLGLILAVVAGVWAGVIAEKAVGRRAARGGRA